ncbi:MAG: UDP-N-acetylglucosamine 1-carboxyvinyltransferase [Candidatus Woykebacteria bacterium]
MAKYVIEGGVPLHGRVKIPGAKNAGFKMMIASLLSDDLSTLTNIPYIRDVISISKIIESLGAKVERSEDTVQVSGGIKNWEVPEELGLKSRASFMYLPILLARFKKGKVPLPVGDQIGERPISWFLEGLQKMGAEVVLEEKLIEVSAPSGLSGVNFTFPKNSHTGTEGLIMAACLAKGNTRIENAATEPEVDDLIAFLNKMGAKIKRVENKIIEINGIESLKGATHSVMPDRNEAVTFGCMALGTRGEVEIEGVRVADIGSFLKETSEARGVFENTEGLLTISYQEDLKPTFIKTTPHPGFMTDWQSIWCALMTQALGESIIHETIFENRFSYAPYLQKMGAKIELFEPKVENPDEFYNFEWNEESKRYPHAVKVLGPTKLAPTKLEVADIRAGATLVFAALMAEGKSEIEGVEHIERGYEDLDGRLENLGAKITKVD